MKRVLLGDTGRLALRVLGLLLSEVLLVVGGLMVLANLDNHIGFAMAITGCVGIGVHLFLDMKSTLS